MQSDGAICIFIATYNRKRQLDRLLGQLDAEAACYPHPIHLRIIDDGSDEPYDFFPFRHIRNVNVSYLRNIRNNGKKLYYHTISRLAQHQRMRPEPKYIMHLADDLEVSEDFRGRFFHAAIARLNYCGYSSCAVNLMMDSRGIRNQWTGFEPKLINSTLGVYQTQWIDGAFIADGKFWHALGYRIFTIPESRWEANPMLGSGVWAQASDRLNKMNWRMFHVTRTMLTHGDHPSKMNPEERRNNPLIA